MIALRYCYYNLYYYVYCKSSYLTSACYYYYYVYALNSRQYYVSYRVCGFFGIHARVFYTIVVAM